MNTVQYFEIKSHLQVRFEAVQQNPLCTEYVVGLILNGQTIREIYVQYFEGIADLYAVAVHMAHDRIRRSSYDAQPIFEAVLEWYERMRTKVGLIRAGILGDFSKPSGLSSSNVDVGSFRLIC